MKVIGNTIVKNEGRYLWFALMSVVDYLDKILVWDTGSSDSTVEIIKEVQKRKPGKIEFKEIGEVGEYEFTEARQRMLEESRGDWIFILDGDEVWWEDSIKKIVDKINKNGDRLDLIANPYISVVGDIYHFQEEAAGQYHLLGHTGHLNIRAISKKIPGLHVDKPYGEEGYYDSEGNRIQDRDPKRMIFIEAPYLHFSNIERSDKKLDDAVMQRRKKIRHELGIKFSKDFKYPEVFYLEFPEFLKNPWVKMDNKFLVRSIVETPLRKIKRRIV